MDEKIAEVANLTLRLREMSGQVMWFENIQNEKSTEIGQLQAELQQLRANLASRGLSLGHDEVSDATLAPLVFAQRSMRSSLTAIL